VADDFLNRIKVWSLGPVRSPIQLETGSISGTDSGYLRVVQSALEDQIAFSKFKANREYREILEHVDRELGRKYFQVIKRYGGVPNIFYKYLKSNYCSPFRYTYKGLGRVSPSNLRYGKIALDLRALFGPLDDFEISEIGIGYGGQYHAISTITKFKSYTFYDLPQVVKLAELYLSRVCPDLRIHKTGNFNVTNPGIDLVISNYAFSELDRTLQEIYFNNVIINSKRGYLIYNDIGKGAFDTIGVAEFAKRIPGAVIINEFPLTHKNNTLVIWGHVNLSQLVLTD
jgi:hypothetical protein